MQPRHVIMRTLTTAHHCRVRVPLLFSFPSPMYSIVLYPPICSLIYLLVSLVHCLIMITPLWPHCCSLVSVHNYQGGHVLIASFGRFRLIIIHPQCANYYSIFDVSSVPRHVRFIILFDLGSLSLVLSSPTPDTGLIIIWPRLIQPQRSSMNSPWQPAITSETSLFHRLHPMLHRTSFLGV